MLTWAREFSDRTTCRLLIYVTDSNSNRPFIRKRLMDGYHAMSLFC